MGKRIAIVQSSYLPWKGYFDMIASVDEFILYDDMQFTKNDWRNRNLIKTPTGTQWLSVPVGQDIDRRIRDVVLPNPAWQEKHWRSLRANYARAACYDEIAQLIEPVYRETRHTHLSTLNRALIETVCGYLGIRTRVSVSWDYVLTGDRNERIAGLCRQTGASEYVSGPSARGYLDTGVLHRAGIGLSWFDYDGYPEYRQLWGDFVHGVSILDLLFNCGAQAPRYMKHVRS